MTRAERRRLRYHHDEGYRLSCLQATAKAEGRSLDYLTPRKQSWTVREVCDVVGVSLKTFNLHQRYGLIPLPTYPSGVRRYWSYQVLLIVRIYQKMRREGWPVRMPKYAGSLSWQTFMADIQNKWKREGVPHVDWQSRNSNHD